jgi:membrane protease subunit HflC
MNRIGLIIGGVLLALMLLSSTLFIVDQRQVAVVYALGEIKEVVQEPGLKFKLPPPFQNVVFLDRRIQTLDSAENRAIFTAEKKSLVIDWLVKWRISDPRQFIRNNGVDIRNLEPVSARSCMRLQRRDHEADRRCRAVDRARQGRHGRPQPARRGREVVRHRRARRPHQAGRLRRQHLGVDLQPDGSRAQAGRESAALDRAAEGEKIRADADRQREVILAEAYRDAQTVKGDGDAKASALFADAFGRDPQFAQFYRSLEAYRASFRSKGDVIVVDPNTDFFKALRGGSLSSAPAQAPVAPAADGDRERVGPCDRCLRAAADRRRPAAVSQPGLVAQRLRARAADERWPDPLSRHAVRTRRAVADARRPALNRAGVPARTVSRSRPPYNLVFKSPRSACPLPGCCLST